MQMITVGQWLRAAARNIRLALQRGRAEVRNAFGKVNAGRLQLTDNPQHLLSSANIGRGSFRVDLMDEQSYAQSVFLDADRRSGFRSKGSRLWQINIGDLPELIRSIKGLGEASLCIISHPGFCGSTLMANMLEALPGFFVYREPVVWRRLTDLVYEPELAQCFERQHLDDICLATFRLFSRTWSPDQQAVVKSIPGAMGLDCFAFRLVPSIRYVYLRPGLEAYLASLFRNPGPRFRWIDDQLSHEWLWLDSQHSRLRKDLRRLSRHLRAALHWQLHGEAMARFASRHRDAVLTVGSQEFFRDKAGIVGRVSAHFGRQAGEDEIGGVLQAGVASYHAKDRTRRYDENERVRQEALLISAHRGEIEEAASWLATPANISQD